MPRIRSIKPECLQHRKVGRLSDRCVRVWLGMLTHADDEGRLPCDPGEVLGWCGFSYHRGVTEDHVEEAIQLIQKTHLIQTYSSNGTRYAWFPSWKDHQVINRPTPSKLPPPPTTESSVNDLGALNDPSLTTPEGSEGKGRDLSTLSHSAECEGQVKKKRTPDPNISKIVRIYHDTYLETIKSKPTINGGRCGAVAKSLLRGRSVEEAAWLITEFFQNPPQFYADKNLWGMEHVLSAANTLLARSTKPRFANERDGV